jgi:site-specific DNA-adenine methylase
MAPTFVPGQHGSMARAAKSKEVPTFPYPGGKGRLSPKIVEYIPKIGRKFVDVFGGRGNVTFRAIAEGLDYREWVLNDILTARFFRSIRDHGDKFKATEKSHEQYERYAELAKHGDPDALLMEPFLCFNGGTYEANKLKGKGGGRRTPESYTNIVRLACQSLRDKNVKISALDWLDCLRAEQLGPDDFVMVDAPYIGCNVGAYTAESICPTELIEYLQKAPFPWVFTEYEQPIYVKAFGQPAYKKEVQLRSCDVQKTKESRTECIWTNIGKTLPTVTVTFQPVPKDRTQTHYTKLSVPALLEEIKDCMGSVDYSRSQMNKEMRDRLLPALLELKKRTYRKKPGYYDCLKKIGLNGDLVRQWFYRSYTADEAIDLIEENKPEPPAENQEDEQSMVELLLEHAHRMAQAALADKNAGPYVKKLATQYIETWSENRGSI